MEVKIRMKLKKRSKAAFTLAECTLYSALSDDNRKSAFTLAEVLITLGIIGVVAALTLPTLINRTRQKELETNFKKQYSILQQAIMFVKNQDELELSTETYGHSNFMRSLAKQYKVIKDCGSINNNTGCVLLNEDLTFTYYKTLTGNILTREFFDDGGFITSDGTAFFIEQGCQSIQTGFLVLIDVNGYKKGPNRMGYDFFMFQITKEGKVLPMGANGTHWSNIREALCSTNSSNNMNGFTCAYYAVNNKDYFKNLH